MDAETEEVEQLRGIELTGQIPRPVTQHVGEIQAVGDPERQVEV